MWLARPTWESERRLPNPEGSRRRRPPPRSPGPPETAGSGWGLAAGRPPGPASRLAERNSCNIRQGPLAIPSLPGTQERLELPPVPKLIGIVLALGSPPTPGKWEAPRLLPNLRKSSVAPGREGEREQERFCRSRVWGRM